MLTQLVNERGAMRYIARLALVSATAVLLVFAANRLGGRSADLAMPAAHAEDVAPIGSRSPLGAYLAGRSARQSSDTRSAAIYFRQALERDPDNLPLAEQVFLTELAEGDFASALAISDRLERDKGALGEATGRLLALFKGVTAFKAGDFSAADAAFKASTGTPVSDLTALIARGWTKIAAGDANEGLSLLSGANQPEWAQFYLRYHRALAADMSGRRSEARQSFERAFKSESRTLRVALAYARHVAGSGDLKLARSIVRDHLDKAGGEGHPMARALRDELVDGAVIAPIIAIPAEGLSEMLYGLGEALTAEGGVGVGTLYLQLALDLAPDSPFALAALANVHETTKHYDLAIEVYNRMPPGTPMQSAVDVRKALNLNLLDRTDEARALLDRLAASRPSDLAPLDALGSIMRAQKRWSDAVDYYTRAIALIQKAEKKHWTYWYNRGTSFERLKQWPRAEADLQRALQLYPDQPLVLNYLGYSWIDQNLNLKKGLQLIERAVALKPDDGYIIDSLGWAHFKLGNFPEAVRYLERAVELRPEDPVLNDHLGDALWRVGRTREARYQWEQALTLKAEPEDVVKINAKLQNGLPPIKAAVKPQRPTREARDTDVRRKRVDSDPLPTSRVR